VDVFPIDEWDYSTTTVIGWIEHLIKGQRCVESEEKRSRKKEREREIHRYTYNENEDEEGMQVVAFRQLHASFKKFKSQLWSSKAWCFAVDDYGIYQRIS